MISLVCRVANRKLQVDCFTNVWLTTYSNEHEFRLVDFIIKVDAGCGVEIQDELVFPDFPDI